MRRQRKILLMTRLKVEILYLLQLEEEVRRTSAEQRIASHPFL
jgi:hypothetical protein